MRGQYESLGSFIVESDAGGGCSWFCADSGGEGWNVFDHARATGLAGGVVESGTCEEDAAGLTDVFIYLNRHGLRT